MTFGEWIVSLRDVADRLEASPPADPEDFLDLDHWLFLNRILAEDLDNDEVEPVEPLLARIESVRAAALTSPALLASCRDWAAGTLGVDPDDRTCEAFALHAPFGRLYDQAALQILVERFLDAGEPPWERMVLIAPAWVRSTFEHAEQFDVEHVEPVSGDADLARIEIAGNLWTAGTTGPHRRFSDALTAARALMC